VAVYATNLLVIYFLYKEEQVMLKKVLAAVMLIGLLSVLGCGGNATTPANNDIEGFFANVSPIPTGIVGNYTYTGDDGSIETGQIVRDGTGNIQLVADRGASIYSNFWFDILVEYDPADVRYYTGLGLPVYYLGDTFTYYINIDYKRNLPLNLPNFLYTKLTSQQRYWPGGGVLPGASTEVWFPFYIAPNESLVVTDDFTIVSGTIPGNDATWISIDLYFLNGIFQFNMAAGACGFWDP
jgi:hypothetical protein